MLPVAPTTPPPPVRDGIPPPHKKIQRSQCKGGQTVAPRRLTSASVLMDDVTQVDLGMILQTRLIASRAQRVVVTTTHTLVLEDFDYTIAEVYPNKPNLLGHVVSFVFCF